MSTPRTELHFEHLKGQSQFAYFLLGLGASAIAFAVHETEGLSLREAPWPFGVAVALWALSFALGCFGVGARQQFIGANVLYLDVSKGIATETFDKAVPAAKESVAAIARRANKYFTGQLWLLFAGALFYIGGHVMQMAATPPKSAVTANETKPMPTVSTKSSPATPAVAIRDTLHP